MNTIRRLKFFIKENVKDVPEKQILLDKLQGQNIENAKNAMLLKTNFEFIVNARSTRRTKKQLPTEARYLSKEAAEAIRAEIAEKKAQKQAKKAQIAEKKAATAG
jgi:hypothetical protein